MQRGVALVTGSSSGFGLRSCLSLRAHGFKVYASMRDLDRGGELERAVAESGFETQGVIPIALDVTSADQREAVVARVLAEDGAVDVLVNNAGTMLTGFVEDTNEASLREQFEATFFAVTALTQALLPAMRERRHGRVINMSSVSGRRALPSHAAYCAAKFALEGWSEALRYEMVPYNVFVSLVEPGLYPTEIFGRNHRRAGPDEPSRALHSKTTAALEAASARMQDWMSWADPADVARVVAEIAVAPEPKLRYPVGIDAWASALSFGPAVQSWWEQYMRGLFRS